MSYRKLTLEQRVSKLERILKLERDREYYNYDDLDDLCKRNYIRWFDLLEDRWRFEYADEYCKRNDCDPELFGGEDTFLFIDDDKTAAPLDIIDVVEDHFG